MRIPLFSTWTALLIGTTVHAAEPSVTDSRTPSPSGEVARRWIVASFQAPLVDYYGEHFRGTEAARMLAALQRGEQPRAGIGWYDPGERRHDWGWFAKTFDANGDGRIGWTELKAEVDFFLRLDRDRDGAITAEDFDWSDRSPWVNRSAQSLRFFRAIDRSGNGKIDEAEMVDYFRKLAGEKEYWKPEDLRDALLQAAAIESGKGKVKAKKVSDRVWLQSLFAGDLGSPFEGPRVGQQAPDFTLMTQDGKRSISLSNYRDKQPVVLIFGSLT